MFLLILFSVYFHGIIFVPDQKAFYTAEFSLQACGTYSQLLLFQYFKKHAKSIGKKYPEPALKSLLVISYLDQQLYCIYA